MPLLARSRNAIILARSSGAKKCEEDRSGFVGRAGVAGGKLTDAVLLRLGGVESPGVPLGDTMGVPTMLETPSELDAPVPVDGELVLGFDMLAMPLLDAMCDGTNMKEKRKEATGVSTWT